MKKYKVVNSFHSLSAADLDRYREEGWKLVSHTCFTTSQGYQYIFRQS